MKNITEGLTIPVLLMTVITDPTQQKSQVNCWKKNTHLPVPSYIWRFHSQRTKKITRILFSSQLRITLKGDKGLHLEPLKFYCQASKVIIDYFVHVKLKKLTVPCEGTPKKVSFKFSNRGLNSLRADEIKLWLTPSAKHTYIHTFYCVLK